MSDFNWLGFISKWKLWLGALLILAALNFDCSIFTQVDSPSAGTLHPEYQAFSVPKHLYFLAGYGYAAVIETPAAGEADYVKLQLFFVATLLVLTLGIAAFVSLFTRQVEDALYIACPLIVFSLIGGVLLKAALHQQGYNLQGGPFWQPVVYVIAASLMASFAVKALQVAGLMENELAFDPQEKATTSEEASGKRVRSADGSWIEIDKQGEDAKWSAILPAKQEVDSNLQWLTSIKFCPFCGFARFRKNGPQDCPNCKHTLALPISERQPRCFNCDSGQADDALFCHECGHTHNPEIEVLSIET